MSKAAGKSSTPRKQKGAGEEENTWSARNAREEPEDNDPEEEEGGTRYGDIYVPPAPLPACTHDSTGPRLIITHIENEFFKSYANKQVLGPFHKSFTAIVGPNGSGKSNVIDSMLFVFGYRAQKIRSKKISVLIHNSDKHKNVNSCTVSVHFQLIVDKGADFEVVPNSQFVISRTAFRDNSSYYQVDGKRVQFKVVAKLLRSHGVDLDHNRFLILQGEVEQIAMMKPKAQNEHETGMLEYLEDIIGTSRFKEPIEILNKRVEELNEARTEKVNRVKLVEKEKDELESPKEEAVVYLRVENETVHLKNKEYQKYVYEMGKTLTVEEEKRKKIDDSIADVKLELAELRKESQARDGEVKALHKEVEALTQKKEELKETFKKLDNEDIRYQENLKHLNANRKKMIAAVKADKEKLEELKRVPEANAKEIEQLTALQERNEALRVKEQAKFKEVQASLRSETKELEENKEKLESELTSLKEIADEKRSAYEMAQSELSIYLSNEKNEQAKLDQIRENAEKTNSTLKERKEQIKAINKEIPTLEKKLVQAQNELRQVSEREAFVTEEVRKYRLQVEEAKASMQANSSRGRVLDAIMEQKQNGSIAGIFGRLGDLGAIDAKYDVAISTACGYLDHIVVDNVTTGQRCIEYLKKHNVGIASFIALDKQERWKTNASRTMQTPENVARLFDLVKIQDNRLRTAFYFALRDTLVANDLEQATRIAYGAVRHRVVTLKGEVIETSGTMSGGGKQVTRGRMGQKVRVSDVSSDQLPGQEQKLRDLTNEASELQSRKVHLEDEITQSSRDLKNLKANLEKHTVEIKALEERLPVLESQLKEQQVKLKNSAPDKAKVKAMETAVAKTKAEFEVANESAEGVEKEFQSLQKKIDAVTGGRMKEAQKKLNDLKKQIDKVSAEITRLNVATKTAARNTKKTEDKIARTEQEIHEAEDELRKMTAARLEIETKAKDNMVETEEIQVTIVEKREQLDSKKEELNEATAKENKLKASKIEVDQELDKAKKTIDEMKAKMNKWKQALKHLKLEDIPGETLPDDGKLPTYEAEELATWDMEQLVYQLSVKEEQLKEGKPNLAVIAEYKKKEELYIQRAKELDEITDMRNEQRKHHEDLRKQRLNEFMAGFTTITTKLKEMYQMITLGGDAELELVDSLDPFSEGINFSVRPPKKSWKCISNLSGGEKTLSSLALVFALHYYKPTPLYVMDEIDAALDFKNVSIVANYVKERTKNAQFIIISLRSNMFELADRLVGIYKTFDCTKSVTINPGLYCKPEERDEQDVRVHLSQGAMTPPAR